MADVIVAVNAIRDAVVAIESELGLAPSAVYPDVRTRLDALEAKADALGTTNVPYNYIEKPVQIVAIANIANFNSPGQVFDGYYQLQTNDSVLVINQTNAIKNGIYIANDLGQLIRRIPVTLYESGTSVFVEYGFVYKGKRFILNTIGTVTPGTTPQLWVKESDVTEALFKRKTQLDSYLLGEQGSSNYVRSLLAEATVICPFFNKDRYWDASANFWKSKNYGSLGDGIIVGDATNQTEQLKYSDGRKGCRAITHLTTGVVRMPVAWLDPNGAWTILVRYQRPSGYDVNFSRVIGIGDQGDGDCRFMVRSSTTDVMSTTIGSLGGLPASSYNPRVLVCTGASGVAGAVTVTIDGQTTYTGTKNGAAVLSGLDHIFGGFWLSGVTKAHAFWSILDIVVIPRVLNTSEIVTLTSAVQFPDTPELDLLTGQSNMVGPGNILSGTSANELPIIAGGAYTDESYLSSWETGWGKCTYAPNNGFGPEITIAQARPNRYYLKFAASGQASGAWITYSSGIVTAIADGLMRGLLQLSCRPVVKNFVFFQGETDAGIPAVTMTPAYRQAQLTAIASQWRRGFNRSPGQIKFILPRVNIDLIGRTVIITDSLNNVRAGDAAFVAADGNAALIDIDGVELKAAPDVHYTSDGVLEVGRRIAAAIQ